MNVAVLGVTGKTGRHFVEQALAADHTLRVLVRVPANFEVTHPNLTVVQGDATDTRALREVFQNQDAVVSIVGTGCSVAPTTLYSKSAYAIVEAMREVGVNRLVCVTSGGVVDDPQDPLWYRLLKYFRFRDVYRDMKLMEDIVGKSQTRWTIVRPTYLTDSPQLSRYRTAINRSAPPKGWKISRADVAHFLLYVTEHSTFVHQRVSLAY